MADDTDWGAVGSGAASGAAIGTMVAPGIGTGVGAGLGAAMGFMSGGGAAAARKAAEERQAAAAAYMAQVQANKKQAVSMVMTPAALAAHDRALASQEQQVRRQEALVASFHPTLIEAGKQAKQLLDGKSAPVLDQIKQQRDYQKQQFMQSLRQQMGPGAESSTAGIQAMQKFDLDTNSMLSQAQQSYLQQVSSLAIDGSANLSDTMNKVDATLSSINANGPQNEAARIMTGFANAEGQAASEVTQAAGGQHLGEVLQAQQRQQQFGQMLQAGAYMYGKQAATPGTQAQPPGQKPNPTLSLAPLPDVNGYSNAQGSTFGDVAGAPPSGRTGPTNFREAGSGYFPGGAAGGLGVDSRQDFINKFGSMAGGDQ